MFEEGPKSKSRMTGGVLLFTASFFLYVLASPGNLPGDTEIRWSVSRQILCKGSFYLEEDCQTRNCSVGVDGRRYSFYGIGQSVCMLPFASVSFIIEKIAGVNARTADLVGQFLASIVLFPLIGATLVWLFYKLIIELGYDEIVAMLSAGILAFATMNFHYSVNTQEQTQIALLLILAVLILIKYHQKQNFFFAFVFCVVLGICLIFRLDSAVMVFPLYLIAVLTDAIDLVKKKNFFKKISRWFFAGLLGTGGFIIFCGWYNFVRFGSIFESGYLLANATALGGHRMFESDILPTLAAMLFSPGKSIFLYNPVFLFFPVCYYWFYRKHKIPALIIAGVVIPNFCFYSFFTAWAGDYAWSVRYQVPILAFLVLPLVMLFARPLKTFIKTILISIIFVSVIIQAASVVYNFNLEFVQNPNHNIIPDDYVWDWSQSHLRKRFENIINHITGRRSFSTVKVVNEEPMLLKYDRSEKSVENTYCINFFPFKALQMLPSSKLFYSLLCLWFILLTGFGVVVLKLIRYCRHLGCLLTGQ